MDPAVIAARRAAIELAWSSSPIEKMALIMSLAKGKKVLDVGCVDHFPAASEAGDWLHRTIVSVAGECLGVDSDQRGVEHLKQMGFHVVVHDIEVGASALASFGQFDLVVAGDVLEHLDTPRALFDLARDTLRIGGDLVISTPNPYAPWRARAGQLGIIWENVDHVAYFHPSGVVELAERVGGLELRLVATDDPRGGFVASPLRGFLATCRQFVNRKQAYLTDMKFRTPLQSLLLRIRPSERMGETLLFVFRRSDSTSPPEDQKRAESWT